MGTSFTRSLISNTKILIDSNILILASVGQVDMRAVLAHYDKVFISIITKVEVLGFNFLNDDEQAVAEESVAATSVLPFTETEAQHAIAYRKLKKIKFPDAAILATARATGADLLTENTKDFAGLDAALRVLAIADL